MQSMKFVAFHISQLYKTNNIPAACDLPVKIMVFMKIEMIILMKKLQKQNFQFYQNPNIP